MPKPEFDIAAAHKYFAVGCFNQAWGLIDKSDRTPEEDEMMISLAHASIWHWTQRDDCIDRNMSIGYWQASRIYALLGQADNARRYGQLSLDYSKDSESFYIGFAYEALARAESLAGNKAESEEYLGLAKKLADSVTDAESKKMLLDDLATIAS